MGKKLLKQLLIDMPFSLPECPAFGLAQIQSYLVQQIPQKVETSVLYLNHDFYDFFGEDIYKFVNKDFYKFYKFDENRHLWVDDLRKSGLEVEYFGGSLGDWIFRKQAFPDIADNSEEYFRKYYINNAELIERVLGKRNKLKEQLIFLLNKYCIDKYDIVGFTSRFQQQTASLAMARLLKNINPKIVTVIGGPNLEPPAGAAIAERIEHVDYILSGRRFLLGYQQLIESLYSNNEEDIIKIEGIYNKSKNAETYREYRNTLSEEDDINVLLDLNYDDYFKSLDNKFPYKDISPVLFLETSRGCSWGEKQRCNFCAIDGYNPKHRYMTSENAIKYIQSTFNKYKEKCKYYVFVDSTIPKHYIYDVFPYVNIPENSILLYEARADLNEEEIRLLSGYHIKLLIVGIESFSTKALNLLNKGMNAFDNIKFLKLCRQFGIAVNWNILVGIPNETDEMIQENLNTIKIIQHLYPPTGVWLISFQGNCEYNLNKDKHNIILEPDIKAMSLVYPYPKPVLNDMTYFKYQTNSSITKTRAVLIQKISKGIKHWKDRWYASDFKDLPKLYFKGSNTVVDTRKTEKIVSIDILDYKILTYLNQEHSASDIQIYFKIEKEEVESRLDRYVQYDFIFKEDGQYLNLITNNGQYTSFLSN